MHFTLSEDQRELQRSVREFLADRFPIERVAEIADGGGWDQAWWAEAAELGWTGIGVPEESGGLGMGFVEEAVVLEELGRALFPGPFLSTTVLAVPALARQPDLLEPIAAGKQSATLAWATDDDEEGGRVRATGASDGEGTWTLEGTAMFVPDLSTSDLVVVAGSSADGPGLWAVDAESDGVLREELSTVDTTRRLGRLLLRNVTARALVEPDATPEILALRDRARAALAAEAVGVSQRVLEYGIEHARTREQFGRPIGVYQAVSHALADAFVTTESARSLVYWAAWAVANDAPEASQAAAAAKAFATEAAVATCETAIQVHGGIGFTWEHPLHRYYKRALALAAFLGWPQRHRAAVARTLLD